MATIKLNCLKYVFNRRNGLFKGNLTSDFMGDYNIINELRWSEPSHGGFAGIYCRKLDGIDDGYLRPHQWKESK